MAGYTVTRVVMDWERALCPVVCCVLLGDTLIFVLSVFIGKE